MSKILIITLSFIVLIAAAGGTAYFYFKPEINFFAKPTLYSPTNEPVTKAPATLTLELTSPEQDLLIFQPSVVVSGQTGAKSTVLISSQSQNLVLEAESDGSFSTILELDEGVNNITIAVFNKNGDQRSIDRTVYYEEEKL